jgi:DNA polymerase-4
LQRKGYVGKTIGIKLRFDNFKSITRDHTLDHFTANPSEIRQVGGLCLKRVDLKRRLRLLGVRVGSLVKADADEAQQHDTIGCPNGVIIGQKQPPQQITHE